jgi:hypothetical protein
MNNGGINSNGINTTGFLPLPLKYNVVCSWAVEELFGTVTSTIPRYGHPRSNGFDWLKVFLQKYRKKGTLITSWYTLCGSA